MRNATHARISNEKKHCTHFPHFTLSSARINCMCWICGLYQGYVEILVYISEILRHTYVHTHIYI